MIRENQRLFNVFNVLLDIMVLIVTGVFILSSSFISLTGFVYVYDYSTIVTFFLFVIPSYTLLYYAYSLYTPQRTNRSIFTESSRIIQVNIIVFIFLMILISLRIVMVTQGFMLFFLFINTTLAIFERAVVRGFLRIMRIRGFNIKYVLIIGAGDVGTKLVQTIKSNPYLGYKIIGFLDDNVEGTVDGIEVIGNFSDINRILNENMIDRVIVSVSPRHYEVLESLIETCEKNGVRADIVPDYYRYISTNPDIEMLGDVPLLSVRFLPLDITYNDLFKRLFDIVFVTIASIILSPLLVIIALIIKLTSTGPIIYKQERVGKNGKIFMIYKFRSMRSENEYIDEMKWTQKDDPRITSIGKIIRKTSIDELPQFYNILKGDMSLIGPRPERPYFVNKFKESVPRYMIKHQVRPGMTGWAQINGYRGNTSLSKRIDYDIFYVENWSIMLDLRIFLRTIPVLLTDKNAY